MDNFNSKKSTVMHIDLNSCFASIEQQANPLLRGKCVVVSAYGASGGCILASSVEAKKLGIKTGMSVKEAKLIFPGIIALEPDPNKYRFVHLALRKIFKNYTNNFYPKSIDEFVLHLDGHPITETKTMFEIGSEIKTKIKTQIGDYLTVSVGIGPSRFIAKTASNLKKPDGLEEINSSNFYDIYSKLSLLDLNGINVRNEMRLKRFGIRTVLDFYNSPIWKLKAAFSSINGYYWYLRLRGYEIDGVEFERRSFGNSFALPRSNGGSKELLPILQKLCVKTGDRLRKSDYRAKGISLFLSYKKGGLWGHHEESSYWHKSKTLENAISDSRDIYKNVLELLKISKTTRPVHTVAISCFSLKEKTSLQFSLFEDLERKENLVKAVDLVNSRWGEFVVSPARMTITDLIKDRIAFGGVKEL